MNSKPLKLKKQYPNGEVSSGLLQTSAQGPLSESKVLCVFGFLLETVKCKQWRARWEMVGHDDQSGVCWA